MILSNKRITKALLGQVFSRRGPTAVVFAIEHNLIPIQFYQKLNMDDSICYDWIKVKNMRSVHV